MKKSVFLAITLFVLNFKASTQNMLLGGGVEYRNNYKIENSDLTYYSFPKNYFRYNLSPAIEVASYFGVEIPLSYSVQKIKYTVGQDWRSVYQGPPVANLQISDSRNNYSAEYKAFGYGLLPYISVGNKIRLQLGLGFYRENCRFDNYRLVGSRRRYHYDSTVTLIEDSYVAYDTMMPDKHLGVDRMLLLRLGLQVPVGKRVRLFPSVTMAISNEINSLELDRKNSYGFSLTAYFKFTPAIEEKNRTRDKIKKSP